MMVLSRVEDESGGEIIRLLKSSTPTPNDNDSDFSVRKLYAAHAGELYGYSRHHLHDPALAEDVVQETFVRAWRAADRYDPQKGSPRAWLFAICRNVIIDMGRRQSVRPLNATREQTERDIAVDGSDLDQSLDAIQMEEAMRHLSADHRQVLVETYFNGKSSAQAAAKLGISEGTVRSRQFYALKALRLAMEEMGWSDE